jgi:hypothetical protein
VGEVCEFERYELEFLRMPGFGIMVSFMRLLHAGRYTPLGLSECAVGECISGDPAVIVVWVVWKFSCGGVKRGRTVFSARERPAMWGGGGGGECSRGRKWCAGKVREVKEDRLGCVLRVLSVGCGSARKAQVAGWQTMWWG